MAVIRNIKVDLNTEQYVNAEISMMEKHCFIIVTKHDIHAKKPLAVRTKKCDNVTEAFQFFNKLIMDYKEN